ncbi:MAG: haloalkane dehalogenase [Pseudomonadota bacterium]
MQVLRTPESRFEGLAGYPFQPNYADVKAPDGTALRMHYLDEGPKDGEIVLCLHGQPSWSYLYRKMIPPLTAAGYRVLAPDLIGFGRSDKPASPDDYAYEGHIDWVTQWMVGLDLKGLTLMCQDWGGLIGLRVAANHLDRFKRLVIANTGLPNSDMVSDEMAAMMDQIYPTIPTPGPAEVQEAFQSGAPGAFLFWVKYCAENPDFKVRDVFKILSAIDDEAVLDGYEAPFPDDSYQAGARAFPSRVPLRSHHKADREAGDKAWAALAAWDGPVLTAFSDGDPVTAGGEKRFQDRLPGAKGRAHPTIENAGHFLQEEQPGALAGEIIKFMKATA